MDAGERGDDGRRVALLELVDPRSVDDARQHLPRLGRLAQVGLDEAVELGRIVARRLRRDAIERRPGLAAEGRDDGARLLEGVGVVLGEVVGDAGMARVHVAPPSSSAVTSSPVAALTSGGPPRKMVPVFCTMIVSSLIAGT